VKLLLDTHLLLWSADRPEQLSSAARMLLADPENTLLFSAAGIWEISVKSALRRKDFAVNPSLFAAICLIAATSNCPSPAIML